jgi:ribonuclease PH
MQPNSIHRTKAAPTGAARDQAYQRLLDRVKQTAPKVKEIPEADIDAAIDEAADFVRHNRE